MEERPEEKRHVFRGRGRVWQLAVCLVLFVAALFLRAFTPLTPGFLSEGASSLRELARGAGQALARSELAEAFAQGFGEAYTGAASSAAPATRLTKRTQVEPPEKNVREAPEDEGDEPDRVTQTKPPEDEPDRVTQAEPPQEDVRKTPEGAGDEPDCVTRERVEIAFAHTAPLHGRVTSAFGLREHPVDGGESFHYGIDLAAAEGTEVRAFADGEVSYAGTGEINGKYLKIRHADGIESLYAHLSALKVCVGDRVERGQVVALSGATGKVTGPHLHFQLYEDGLLFDPEPVLRALEEED